MLAYLRNKSNQIIPCKKNNKVWTSLFLDFRNNRLTSVRWLHMGTSLNNFKHVTAYVKLLSSVKIPD